MVIVREAKMTNQQAWDELFRYSWKSYGRYNANKDGKGIRDCMEILDRHPDIQKETYDNLKITGTWRRSYTIKPSGKNPCRATISVEFDQKDNRIYVNSTNNAGGISV